ncbi:LysR family transcriptional regulator [Jannaschia sp. LMIT008]|uniref:LysR family transcriptional regulator n=1 Tax=Jannaschia maritima TaxID=3032585 RepID=UPI0028126EF4|nr:LysR family transcriptional regulator [Jannaschia sp. LMIT008]
MPDPDIELFLRVVETGSLKAAATEAKATPSSVTRRIAKLEGRLGAKLLIRSTRRSRPTEAGQAYYDGVRRIVDEQAALEAEIAGLADTPRGFLRVTAPVDFGARFVTPVVDRLLSEYPELSVELNLGSDFADLREANVDVAVRIGSLSDSALIARRFGSVPRAIVVAPSYFQHHDRPERPEDLARHPFIFYRPAPEMKLHLVRAGESVTVAVTWCRIAVNSMSAVREFMFSGQGMALSPLWACEDALADGRVVRVLEDWQSPAFPLHGVFLPGPFHTAKLRVFLDAMAARIKAEPSLTAT